MKGGGGGSFLHAIHIFRISKREAIQSPAHGTQAFQHSNYLADKIVLFAHRKLYQKDNWCYCLFKIPFCFISRRMNTKVLCVHCLIVIVCDKVQHFVISLVSTLTQSKMNQFCRPVLLFRTRQKFCDESDDADSNVQSRTGT